MNENGHHAQTDPQPADGGTPRRRWAAVLAAGVLVVVVVVGIVLASLSGRSGSDREPRAAAPSESVTTPVPSESPAPPESPAASASPSPSPSTSPTGPALAEYDRARADVDGDGTVDVVTVRIPAEDAAQGPDVSMVSRQVVLQAALGSGRTSEVDFGETLAPTIAGTPDLDEDGAAEVVLSFSGGDGGWLKAFTWDGDGLLQANPAADSPARLVDDGGIYMAPDVAGAALDDGRLVSWVGTDDTTAPYQVRVWTWRLEGAQLDATEAEQVQCTDRGRPPEPC